MKKEWLLIAVLAVVLTGCSEKNDIPASSVVELNNIETSDEARNPIILIRIQRYLKYLKYPTMDSLYAYLNTYRTQRSISGTPQPIILQGALFMMTRKLIYAMGQ